ncbi:hypothetical protein C8R43DRAFT_907503 [Mycena crocata]|nr:hypothetical protein C8R43DRAFT_907503 [Mycena crocata]
MCPPGPPQPLHGLLNHFPVLNKGASNGESETMDNFFARRQEANRQRAYHETLEEARRREQREVHVSDGAVPGKKGARVFRWENTNGFYICRAAGHSKYEDLWQEYGPCQRRYDGYYHEWDLCEAFGRNGAEPDANVYDESPLHAAAETAATNTLRARHLQLASETESVEYGLIAQSFKEMVYLRFGCTLNQNNLETQFDLAPELVIKKILGDTKLAIPDEAQMNYFRVFLAKCQKATSPHDIPWDLLDFHQPMSELYETWTVQVRRETLNGRIYYVVAETCNACHLYILLESATTTLEIVRQGWGPSLQDVISNLLRRGVPFFTCFRCDEVPTGKPGGRNPYSGLGFRPENYKPDHHDYQTYVALRSVFLQSPRGRAALLSGGIIGRLARALVPDEEVLRGPSDDATINGICLWDGHSQQAYWDDTLTEQEIDLICGVYRIYTGRSFYNLQKIPS